MKVSKYFLFFSLLIFACHNIKRPIYVGENIKCDFIDTNSFFKLINKKWPARKPNSIADAVELLDTMADDNFKCTIIKMDGSDLYFTLGLKIRNDWVRHGTANIRDQLFYKLKLTNVDYSSGLIIDIYRQFLTTKKVDLVRKILKTRNDSSAQIIKVELLKIQEELSWVNP